MHNLQLSMLYGANLGYEIIMDLAWLSAANKAIAYVYL
jgi:hypothetical protein